MTSDKARVCGVRAADGGARLYLTVELAGASGAPREELVLLSARLQALPRVGDITEAELAFYQAEDAFCRASVTALRLLSATAPSAAGLVKKLLQRGVKMEVAREVARDMIARGFLDEVAGARREAERGVAKLWGNRRILADVAAKGYGKAALAAAAAQLSLEDGASRCAALMRRRHLSLTGEGTFDARVIAALQRYGYSTAEIKAATKKAKAE